MSGRTLAMLCMTFAFILIMAACLDHVVAAASCVGQTFVCDIPLDPSMVTDLR